MPVVAYGTWQANGDEVVVDVGEQIDDYTAEIVVTVALVAVVVGLFVIAAVGVEAVLAVIGSAFLANLALNPSG